MSNLPRFRRKAKMTEEAQVDPAAPGEGDVVVEAVRGDPELVEIQKITDREERSIAIVAFVMQTMPAYRDVGVEERRALAQSWLGFRFPIEQITDWSTVGASIPARAAELRDMGLSPAEVGQSNVPGGATIAAQYNNRRITIDAAVSLARKIKPRG